MTTSPQGMGGRNWKFCSMYLHHMGSSRAPFEDQLKQLENIYCKLQGRHSKSKKKNILIRDKKEIKYKMLN